MKEITNYSTDLSLIKFKLCLIIEFTLKQLNLCKEN